MVNVSLAAPVSTPKTLMLCNGPDFSPYCGSGSVRVRFGFGLHGSEFGSVRPPYRGP